MDIILERLELAIERVKEIAKDNKIKEPFNEYFKQASNFILKIDDVKKSIEKGEYETYSQEQLAQINKDLFEEIYIDNYGKSYANPRFALNTLGEEYGKILCYLYTRLRGIIRHIYKGNVEAALLRIELFIEIYNYFENDEELEYENIYNTIYNFEKDNCEIYLELSVEEMIDPKRDYEVKIVTESDLTDTRYLYRYGVCIGHNELKMAEFLNSLSQEEIDKLATVYTEGYINGFINSGKDLSKKGTAEIRYNVGFERIVKSAIKNFADMGLKTIIRTIGCDSTSPNNQYNYDHKFDDALYFDKAYVKRYLEVVENAFEDRKALASLMAGPAVIEVFGENPFEPEIKKEAFSYSEEQQKLKVEFSSKYQQVIQKYIKGEERSFTIIAFPIPEFGDNFEEMFKETVKINTLDTVKYANVQQKIIDTLDLAEVVRIVGSGSNKTYLTVALNQLKNPEKETNFENCLADVNIPLGEVFTSPKLTGTNGTLHVSKVYLNDLKYNDLELTFEDGKIKDYTCKNFESEEENKKFIKENLLHNHETLPMGEFAIGTNTTAYVIANKYDVVYKLPILIVEKMGPHFAVGDTCYSWEEDVKVYNPDGKEIVARENKISALRNTDLSKAYFGCHTDITIPYDELGEITAVTKEGVEIPIIKDGRFVLKGCELLNEPFDE